MQKILMLATVTAAHKPDEVAKDYRTIAQQDELDALVAELRAAGRFAVATEAFFETPRELAADWPDLFKVLRKFYRHGSDEPQFDLTPATEKAIGWLGTLAERYVSVLPLKLIAGIGFILIGLWTVAGHFRG